MRATARVLLMTATMGLGVACSDDGTGTGTDTGTTADGGGEGVSDAATEVAEDAAADGVDGVDDADAAPSDTPVEASETTPADTTPAETTQCEPLNCPLTCGNGFRHDDAGCEVCACRECDAPSDCAAVIDCAKPVCSDEGMCLCDCGGVSSEAYACPDGGTEVPFCACAARGWSCMAHPETQCPTLCSPQEVDAWPCPDGSSVAWCTCEVPSCDPVCKHVGEANEGWYDGCSGALVREEACGGCQPVCRAIGTRSEGWYTSCGGGLIGWAMCSPQRDCVVDPGTACTSLDCTIAQETRYTCPDGATTHFCECAATGAWDCEAAPWDACTGGRPCTAEGGALTGPGGACCPGLAQIDYATWDGETCGFVDCLCSVCTACGDGVCDPPENPCNCEADCDGSGGPLALGALCGSDAECTSELMCLKPLGGALVGVCSRVCTPGTGGTGGDACGPDAVCSSLAGFQAPGFCLVACDTRGDCHSPLGCGTHTFDGPARPSSCFYWPPCDPLAGAGCGDAEQCRVAAGQPVCGLPGTLARGDKCDREADRCGPGLACGALDTCWPTCADDAACRAMQLDFCLKTPSGAPFGHCMFLE